MFLRSCSMMGAEWVIAATIALLVIVDFSMAPHRSRRWLGILSVIEVVIAGTLTFLNLSKPAAQLFADTFRVDPLSSVVKLILLGGTCLVLLLALSADKEELKGRRGEYYYLILSALLGAMFMVSASDLITIFVGLELLSLSSYILVGIRNHNAQSNEAAWRYVILGGISSAFILYGMSFLYGVSGSTNLFEIQAKLFEMLSSPYQYMIYLSFFLLMVGFGFKIAAAPFHMWTPDVYQGASTPITAFLSVVSKAAAFAFVIRILLTVYLPLLEPGAWGEIVAPVLSVVAILSMIVGNTVALRQTNAKRLLAYSSIAQAGYLLVPLATFIVHMKVQLISTNDLALLLFPATLFYLTAYLCMNIGAFAVLQVVSADTKSEKISAFAGLHQRSPWLALAMTIFLISLAGLPITAGFMGKLYLLSYAISGQHFILVGTMLMTTVVSYFYYFGFIRQMYFRPPDGEKRVWIPKSVRLVLGLCVLGTLMLAVFPDGVIQKLHHMDWIVSFNSLQDK